MQEDQQDSRFKYRVRELRLSVPGLTVSGLARIVGKTPGAVNKWEKGEAEPRGRNQMALLDYFKCGLDGLIDYQEPEPSQE